jgi:hypothetical protein
MDINKTTFIGYHGTNSKHVQSILKNNFNISQNADEWIGYGVYFFVDGISCPINNSREWAINQAYHQTDYTNYSILKATITGENVLDLTTQAGLIAFNTMRQKIIEKHKQYFYRDRNIYEDDRLICNLIIQAMNLDLLINNLYIKTKIQRMKIIYSRIPNVTVMLVVNPNKSIDLSSIEEIEKGRT